MEYNIKFTFYPTSFWVSHLGVERVSWEQRELVGSRERVSWEKSLEQRESVGSRDWSRESKLGVEFGAERVNWE